MSWGVVYSMKWTDRAGKSLYYQNALSISRQTPNPILATYGFKGIPPVSVALICTTLYSIYIIPCPT